MQKRCIPILIFAVILALVAGVGYIMPDPVEEVPTRILFDNAAGKVVFNHQKHLAGDNIPCATCHHEMIVEKETVIACGTCHGVAYDETFRTTHASTIKGVDACATCHHMEFASKVDWTHTEHAEEYGLECISCHHEDTDIEPEPQDCANCHESTGDESMPSLRDAVHVKCQSCHEDMFENGIKDCASCHTTIDNKERLKKEGAASFKLNDFYANCAACHTTTPAELIPSSMGAYHGQCITCHSDVGKGPYTQEQCSQCHTK